VLEVPHFVMMRPTGRLPDRLQTSERGVQKEAHASRQDSDMAESCYRGFCDIIFKARERRARTTTGRRQHRKLSANSPQQVSWRREAPGSEDHRFMAYREDEAFLHFSAYL
jgi:hypothetical protein